MSVVGGEDRERGGGKLECLRVGKKKEKPTRSREREKGVQRNSLRPANAGSKPQKEGGKNTVKRRKK